MPSYIQNYGFTKTYINDNNYSLDNEINWNGNYDGKIANIDININDNGNREFVSMKLNNSDLKQLFGIQPVEIPIEKRLLNDLKSTKPITLEGALIKRKSRKHRKKHYKRKKSKRLY
jgi:hypothetical protein